MNEAPRGPFTRQFEHAINPGTIGATAIELHLRGRGIRITPRRRVAIRKYVDNLMEHRDARLSLHLSMKELKASNLTAEEIGRHGIDTNIPWDRVVEDIPKLIDSVMAKALPRMAESYIQQFDRIRNQRLRILGRQQRRFERRLRRRWGPALRDLEMLRWLCLDEAVLLKNEHPKEEGMRMSALYRIHARACQVTGEVISLLHAGYADGAHARWRTLHELSVIANILTDADAEVSERYLLHVDAENLRAARQYLKDADRLNLKPLDLDTIPRLETRVAELVQRFGKKYAGPYGWAYPVVKTEGRIRFSDLEELAGQEHMRSYYKLASQNVHAESKALLVRLGKLPGPDMLIAGPSNAGLAEAGQGAAITLAQITTLLLMRDPNLDRIVAATALFDLALRISDTFVDIHLEQVLQNQGKLLASSDSAAYTKGE